MITNPCRECGEVFWVDDAKIPESFAQSKNLVIIPHCYDSGKEHRMRALGTFELVEPDNPNIVRTTIDIASDYL